MLSHVSVTSEDEPEELTDEATEPVVEPEPVVVVPVLVVDVDPAVAVVPVADPAVACSLRTLADADTPADVPEEPEEVVVVVAVVVDGDVVAVDVVVLPLVVLVAVVDEGVLVVDEGVLVVVDGVVVVVVDVDTPALPVESALPVVVVVPLEPAVVVELEELPTLVLVLWLPASEKLAPDPEPEDVAAPLPEAPLPLDVDTTFVIGSVSVDVVSDCTYTGHVVVASTAPTAAPTSSRTVRTFIFVSSSC